MVMLIPKGGREYKGIGAMKGVWKIIDSIINKGLRGVIMFQNTLHSFREERGTGTAP